MDNDMLFPEDYGGCQTPSTNLMAQLTVNATLAAQELAYTSLPVQDFSSLSGASLALPRCSDNVEAETYGAELAPEAV